MKKGINILWSLVGVLLLLYALMEYNRPKPIDWSPNFDTREQSPFGLYVLEALMDDFFEGRITRDQRTLFETLGEDNQSTLEAGELVWRNHVLVLANRASFDESSISELDYAVRNGLQVFIASESFDDDLEELIPGIDIRFAAFEEVAEGLANSDSAYTTIRMANHPEITGEYLAMHADRVVLIDEDYGSYEVLATNEGGAPVLVKVPYQKGAFYICSLPLAFTNYYLLQEDNAKLPAAMLSQLSAEKGLLWAEYYSLGRKKQSTTPLRYVLAEPALRWAYYIMIFGLLAFMIFEAKRRQRAIRVITPPENKSMEFARTIGRLYYQQQDHTNMARKLLLVWQDQVRKQYRLEVHDRGFAQRLHHMSGHPLKSIEQMLQLAQSLEKGLHISADTLKRLNDHLEHFGGHHGNAPLEEGDSIIKDFDPTTLQ